MKHNKASRHLWVHLTMKLPSLIDFSLILILVSYSNGQQWNITVDNNITATKGADVIILCTFTYPPELYTTDIKVYWKKHGGKKLNINDNDKNAFVFHTNDTFVLETYRGKTELIGNKNEGNCSLRIRNIQENVPKIYVRVIAKNDQYSFVKNTVSIFVSGATKVISTQDDTDTLLTTSETSTTSIYQTASTPLHTPMYLAIFVPVAALLILVFVAGFVFLRKCKRSLVREDSGYYANFSRASSNQVNREVCQKKDNKKIPEAKVIDEPVYINVEAPPDQMDHTDNIYANVDYSK